MSRPRSKPRKPAMCKGCEAPILWALTAGGNRMPLNKAPDPEGRSSWVVSRDPELTAHVRKLAPGEEPRPGIEKRHVPHHITCTNPPPRKPKAPAKPAPVQQPGLWAGEGEA
jgi:hypothetical protein